MIPSQYKATDLITTPHPDVVDYPPPTHLKTLKKSDGHSFFHEEELYMWIKNIIHHKEEDDEALTQTIKEFINSYQDRLKVTNIQNKRIFLAFYIIS